jgi:molybdenum cofactor cytidylyltransferase
MKEGVVERSETGGESTNVVILTLAAGSSSRMGQSKQLIKINGQPLLQKTVDVASASKLGNVVVVLGAFFNEHKEILKDRPVDIVFHQGWQNGMGSSLKAGVRYIQNKYSQTTGIMVMVCDQPFLTAEHLAKLVETHRVSGKSIVASSYLDKVGVPCFFECSLLSEVLTLNDNEGAKKLLQVHTQDVVSVEFPSGEIDLDTPEDLLRMQSAVDGN